MDEVYLEQAQSTSIDVAYELQSAIDPWEKDINHGFKSKYGLNNEFIA